MTLRVDRNRIISYIVGEASEKTPSPDIAGNTNKRSTTSRFCGCNIWNLSCIMSIFSALDFEIASSMNEKYSID